MTAVQPVASVRWLAPAIALVGVVGQLLLLRHELVDCYPYKVMPCPSPETYIRIAHVGLPLVVAASVLVAALLRRRSALLAPIALPAVAPALFATVFLVMAGVAEVACSSIGYASEFTPSAARRALLTASLALSGGGAGVGAVVAAALHGLASTSRVIRRLAMAALILGSAMALWLFVLYLWIEAHQ